MGNRDVINVREKQDTTCGGDPVDQVAYKNAKIEEILKRTLNVISIRVTANAFAHNVVAR